jgi:hypothetical protein
MAMMEGNLEPHTAPATAPAPRRARLEPIQSQPLRRGRCDWCGKKTPRGRTYCGRSCQVSYNNLLLRQGKALVQSLKIWRLHRGRMGTPGAGKLALISARVDALLVEDRARWESEGEGDGNRYP